MISLNGMDLVWNFVWDEFLKGSLVFLLISCVFGYCVDMEWDILCDEIVFYGV